MRPVRSVTWRWSAVLVVALAVMLAAVPQAPAAAPWSAPEAIPGAHLLWWESNALRQVDGLLGFTPGGVGFMVLGSDAGGRGIARFNGSRGTFGPVGPSQLGGVAPSKMGLYGRDHVILGGQADAVGDPRASMNPDILLDAAVTRGSVTGQFTRRQVLAKGIVAGGAAPAVVTALAANPAGDAAVVVSVPVRGRVRVRGFQSWVFVRRHGQSAFKRILAIGRQTVGSSPAALAVNGPGDVLVAWDDRTSVRARLITAGSRVGREQRLGQGGSAFVLGGRMVAVMDGTRRALVAWMAQRVGEGSYAGSPGIVALAYAPAYSGFAPAQVVQRNLPEGSNRGIIGPAVQTALLGSRGVVVWTGYASGRYVVRCVDVTSGRASAPRDLSPAGSDALLRGLAVTSRGGQVATWSTTIQHQPSALYAAARAAGATTWGPIETVTSTGPDPTFGSAVIAASPLSGQAVALWSDPIPPGIAAMPVRFSARPTPG
jgi:hypothetical protein